MKVVTAKTMQKLDHRTIADIGIPGIVLMEIAGRGAAACLVNYFPLAQVGRVTVLAGPGNNGGDGYVIARRLSVLGAEVQIILLAERKKVTGDALINLEVAEKLGIPIHEWIGDDNLGDLDLLLKRSDVIVDALLGTGLSKPVKGIFARVIDLVNASDAYVLAVDLPSGLSADTGNPLGRAVQADLTVTFGLPKVAHVSYPGLDYCQDVEVVDIGIPTSVIQQEKINCELIEPKQVIGRMAHPRPAASHKGIFGHLLVLAGSEGMTGASVLTTRAAACVGAGLVTLGLPKGIAASVEPRLLNSMTLRLPQTKSGSFSAAAAALAIKALKSRDALALGPGLSTDTGTGRFVQAVLSGSDRPAVVDADALNLLAKNIETLIDRKAPTILTPHPGEMARLLKTSIAKVQTDRLSAASRLARKTGAVVVLKGAVTVTVEPSGQAYFNQSGNPGLATGGSGDVLTGMIGGFLAQGIPPFEAAVDAVYLHGLAADRVLERTGMRAMVAGDLLAELPEMFAEIEDGRLTGDEL